jgi:hypothetical protein
LGWLALEEFDHMAGTKQTYQIELNPDQMAFLRSTKDKFDIADEGKVLRIVVDYLLTNPTIHNTVFGETRCLRCD